MNDGGVGGGGGGNVSKLVEFISTTFQYVIGIINNSSQCRHRYQSYHGYDDEK